jgi:hypothetical protein
MIRKTILTAVFLVVTAGNARSDYVWAPGRWIPPRWSPPHWAPGHWVYRRPPYPGPPGWSWRCWPVYRYGVYDGMRCRMEEP